MIEIQICFYDYGLITLHSVQQILVKYIFFSIMRNIYTKTILDCDKNSISKTLWTHIAEADSREVLLLQHLARIPYPVRPSSLGTAKADALWNTVGNISISSPIQKWGKKRCFLVTQWKVVIYDYCV